MDKLNCLGDICPIPMLKLKHKLNSIDKDEEFIIIIDHSCVFEEMKSFFKIKNHTINIEEVMNGVWEILVHKN